MTSSSKTAKTRNMALGKRNKAATTPKKARCAGCPILPDVPCRLVCVRTSIGDTPAPQSTEGGEGVAIPAKAAPPDWLENVEAELRKVPGLDEKDVEALTAMASAGFDYAAALKQREAHPICQYTGKRCHHEGAQCTCHPHGVPACRCGQPPGTCSSCSGSRFTVGVTPTEGGQQS